MDGTFGWGRKSLWIAALLSPLPGVLLALEGNYAAHTRDAAYALTAACIFCIGLACHGLWKRSKSLLGVDIFLLAYGLLIGLRALTWCGLEAFGKHPCV